ncbi:HD domain-containing protein [Shouchella patagoniensis]|uniref:HD domain-containing protein n=1 Tax=Shouchella patagoniensis TaxID=228576 RepID=UPI0009958AB4|nr:HD domain-containing protein [Shouchella patagoniensis]
MNYIQDRDYALTLLTLASEKNPGPWVDHSIHVARATEIILQELNKFGFNLNIDLEYNAALLHDIGRYKGVTKSVIHSYDGYTYLEELGFSGNALVCVTHSFPNGNKNIELAAAWNLVPNYMQATLIDILNQHRTYDLYSKVITLCNALADSNGFTTLEKRLVSVGLRHGTTLYTSLHWNGFYTIKQEIETYINKSVYRLLPGIEESIYSTIN